MKLKLEKLQAIRIAIVHDKCPDGIASALILKDALPHVEIKFVQYGTPGHKELLAWPGMIFADFSPPADRVQEFVDVGAIVLDHHKTAKQVVARFGENGIFGDEVRDPGICGAMLVYEHVWLPLWLRGRNKDAVDPFDFIERFAMLAGVRDTWQNKDPNWYDACVQASALFFCKPEELLAIGLQEIGRDWDSKYLWAGRISHDKHLKRVKRAAEEGYRTTSAGGTRVLLFQDTKLSSEAAELAGDTMDLVVGFDVFSELYTPLYSYSTRSHTSFDCGAFCKAYGGGGHTGAAGFAIKGPTWDPYATLLDCLARYEAKKNAP
jgi:nanoRNase/pAp phosphatase (c-di-AMP/oligoRNAs hydrolase)